LAILRRNWRATLWREYPDGTRLAKRTWALPQATFRAGYRQFGVIFHCVASILWPSRCASCNAYVPEAATFCEVCDVATIPLGRCCPGCAIPLGPNQICRGCVRRPFPFTRAVAALTYGGALTQALLRFKHGGNRHLARPLARYLVPLLGQAAEWGAEIACPVPLHPRRLRQRGFNQALDLMFAARGLARSTPPIDIVRNALVRTLDTPALGHGSPAQRQQVVAGAFAVARPARVAGKKILVVDDVMTTGATLAECSRVLLAAGASQVMVAALARVA